MPATSNGVANGFSIDEVNDDEQYPYPVHITTRPALLDKVGPKPWVTAPTAGYILANALVIDAAQGSLLEGEHDIVVSNGIIQQVVSSGQTSEDFSSLPWVDLTGKYICPGLIDCHVHVSAVPGASGMTDLVYHIPDETRHLRQVYVLKEMINRGFTTIRDCGGASKPLADALAEGLIIGPRLFQSGCALSQTGGHGDFSTAIKRNGGAASEPGCCGGRSLSLGRVCDGVPDCLRAVREELMAGADFIKIMVGGGVLSETDAIESVQYSAEELRAITSTAKAMGNVHTTAHAYTDASALHAINNGVMGIEHGNLLSDSTLQLMADKGIYLCPTIATLGALMRPPFDRFLAPASHAKLGKVLGQGLSMLKRADAIGVPLLFGTDHLFDTHALQTEEFAVRATVLSPPAILRQATVTAAKVLRMEGKLGEVKAGAIADLIVLDNNPLEDITVLDQPEIYLKAVLKEGRVIHSSINKLL